MDNYKEKIKKLLALAGSSNEHEAKAAMLKAREIMGRYKLTEADLEEKRNQKIKTVHTGFIFTSRTDFWMGDLKEVIAENYCCKAVIDLVTKQKMEVCFVGFEDDVEICEEVFRYAVNTVHHYTSQIKKNKKLSATEIRYANLNYGLGFAEGCKEAFADQGEENWGLVMVVPQDVKDELLRIVEGERATTVYYSKKSEQYSKGFEDGKNFKPGRSIKED